MLGRELKSWRYLLLKFAHVVDLALGAGPAFPAAYLAPAKYTIRRRNAVAVSTVSTKERAALLEKGEADEIDGAPEAEATVGQETVEKLGTVPVVTLQEKQPRIDLSTIGEEELAMELEARRASSSKRTLGDENANGWSPQMVVTAKPGNVPLSMP